jgi:hypothetical protein
LGVLAGYNWKGLRVADLEGLSLLKEERRINPKAGGVEKQQQREKNRQKIGKPG